MPRLVNCWCSTCSITTERICEADAIVICTNCLNPMEQRWWERRPQNATLWHPSEWATVFKKPDGTFSFPARADKATPQGCERITIRSDAEMARVEREAGVVSERRWFDKGSGNAIDSGLPTPKKSPRRDTFSE